MKAEILIALAGNPNSGKTTLFNNLTGARQHVGNYPGVTVERKEGRVSHGGTEIRVVDLPGIYSLTAYSADEVVARNFLVEEKPDVVVNVVDASNLERNLYLTVQLKELGVPLVLAFNMSDTARALGYRYDITKLAGFFGAPIVETVGHRGIGMKELLDAVVARASEGAATAAGPFIEYGREVEMEIAAIESRLQSSGELTGRYAARWLAVKLLEGDEEIRSRIKNPAIVEHAARSAARLEALLGERIVSILAARRYAFISGACLESVRSTVEMRHRLSDRIDSVVTNRYLGLPIFLGLMYLVFHFTFTAGEPMVKGLESLFARLAELASGLWPKGSESALKSLLVDGIIGGVGSVIVFLPNIFILFFAIALLEDSGYMARAAFIMDRLMHGIGLHGKSFIPMLIGFGCSVPAIMATRTIENRRDRLTTMLVLPLMSCGARLPIYALIIPAFFPAAWHAPMLWLIYLIGILLAVIAAKVLRSTLLRGESSAFVMELPLYRMPTARGLLLHVWERGWLYLKKAGTLIFCIAVILWVITSYPKKDQFDRDYESETARLQASFLADVRGLNEMIGLSHNSESLVEAVRAEQATRDERRDDAEESSGGTTMERDQKPGEHPDSAEEETVRRILRIRDEIRKVWIEYESTLAKRSSEAGSEPLSTHADNRDAALARLAAAHPKLLFGAAERLYHLEKGFRQVKQEIDQAKRAEELSYSIAGRIGRALEPILKPMGFDWRIGTALIGAVAAKEVFVVQLGIVFSLGETDERSESLRKVLRNQYSPLVAFCIMLFCLISSPCMATIAVTKAESGSWRWALLQFGGLTAMAYVLTVLVYQAGRLAGIGL